MKKILLLLILVSGFSHAAFSTGSFVKTVTAAGSEEALSSSLVGVSDLVCKAEADNTGVIYIGGADVAAANGLQLAAGQARTFVGSIRAGTTESDIEPKLIYLDSSVNGDGVECSWVRN